MSIDTKPTIEIWAAHPSPALRARIAERLGQGWKVESIKPTSAVLVRRKGWTRPAWLLLNPLYLLYMFRKDRVDRVRLTVTGGESVLEQRMLAAHQ